MLPLSNIEAYYNPIDSLEMIFAKKSADFERRNINEVVVEIEGKWNNMLLFFAWEEHLKCLHFSCLMNINVDISDLSKVFELLAMVNENLWLGHFSYWSEHKMPIFKHSIILQDKEENFEEKLNQIIEIAVSECEHMYPVFNAVITQHITPQQALFPLNGILQ
ncbi:MAG: YbjN domain-containing protein [Alphaproteobacteria bacterium]|nr:YbjN domain-containing protein [Alphaproteobacteria bacterium]